MPSKQQIIQLYRVKHKIVAWGLFLPVSLVFLQFLGAAISQNFLQIQTGKANSSALGPTVLGEVSSVRGQIQPNVESVVPQLTAGDLDGVSAKSFLVYDRTAGDKILAARQPQLELSIASLTKLMTGLLAYEHLDFNQPITITKSGLTAVRPIVNFADQDQVRTGDVFDAMIVASCNDAAQVLAREISKAAGQDIINLMNDRAAALGMTQTSFANPLGFDNTANFSTATDLQKLIDATQSYAAFSNLGKTTALDFSGNLNYHYHAVATNTLLKKYPDLFAIKTGFTESAQGAMATKILSHNHEIIILVLGSGDREQDTLLLKQLVVDGLIWPQ